PARKRGADEAPCSRERSSVRKRLAAPTRNSRASERVRRNAVNRDTPSLPPRRRLVLSSLQALLLPLERLSQNPSEQGFPLPLAGVGGAANTGVSSPPRRPSPAGA